MDGDSTVMPQVLTWVDKVFEDMPGCSSDDSRAVVLFLNLPACGVISATQSKDAADDSKDEIAEKQEDEGTALQVLESFATKFMESDLTKDDVMRKITEHNAVFNPNGDFVAGTRRKLQVNNAVELIEAQEVCSDPEGRFFACEMVASTIVIVEKKASPEHLHGLSCLDTPTPLGEVILALEDAGEARVSPKQVI
ncbi:unnamed protein product [Durusdinium trenchii]|uniref:Uncharacterized protein n=1 Tax=Durusdinium trenchii TaxID=1381693 RepID=A0ABP0LEP8_9DINO